MGRTFVRGIHVIFKKSFSCCILFIILLLHSSCSQHDDSSLLPVGCSSFKNNGKVKVKAPEIISFTISPNKGTRGDWFHFSWETEGADRVWIEPAITDPTITLPLSGTIVGKVIYSTWFTLYAKKDNVIRTKQSWVETVHPDGSDCGIPGET